MQNLNDEKLFKLVEEHFGVTYYACDDAVLHDETLHYHSAYPYRAFAQDVIDVALKDLARDAERWSEIGKSIERACGELPEDFEINIHLENGAGTASLLYPSGEECENFPHDDGFAGVVNAAIDAAIAESKGDLK